MTCLLTLRSYPLEQVVPLGGGQLSASGRMWLAVAAEIDPKAVSMQGQAVGVDADALARSAPALKLCGVAAVLCCVLRCPV